MAEADQILLLRQLFHQWLTVARSGFERPAVIPFATNLPWSALARILARDRIASTPS